MFAHDTLAADGAEIVVAGGMESMSNAPYLLERARAGYRMGHGKVLDSMFLDGLEDAYDKGRLMGTFAEDCAEAYQFTRAAAGRVCADLAGARQPRDSRRRLRRRNRADECEVGQDGDQCRHRRAAAQGAARQDPDA